MEHLLVRNEIPAAWMRQSGVRLFDARDLIDLFGQFLEFLFQFLDLAAIRTCSVSLHHPDVLFSESSKRFLVIVLFALAILLFFVAWLLFARFSHHGAVYARKKWLFQLVDWKFRCDQQRFQQRMTPNAQRK